MKDKRLNFFLMTKLNPVTRPLHIIIRKIFYFYPSVGFSFFYLSYNRKRVLNIVTASIMPFLTNKNLNFFISVAYNPYFFRNFLGLFFYFFKDYSITLKTTMFMNFIGKIK